MKIFILEDDPMRISQLIKVLGGHDLTIIDTCRDADLFQPPYDLVLLDHDLGSRQLEEHEDSGTAFAELIKDRMPHGTPYICHSYNPAGAFRMWSTLGASGTIAPFGGAQFWNRIKAVVGETADAGS